MTPIRTSSNYLNTNNLHTVKWFHVFLSNTYNFQTDPFDP